MKACGIGILLCFLFPSIVSATEVTIRPFLIDENLPPRGNVVRNITLQSDYDYRKAVIFATVNEISVDSKGEIKEFISPVMTDRTNTVTSWIEIGRGRIEIPAGETVEVPLEINVHPYAEPGEYHAFIGFVEVKNRPMAESIARAGDAKGVVLKITVNDQREDGMRVNSFSVERFVTGVGSRPIDITIENYGDVASAPKGEIIFYDSRGTEVAAVPVNSEGVVIEPGEVAVLTSAVPVEDTLGRFKANMQLQYGIDQRASLHDSAAFYMMPTKLLVFLFGGVLFFVLLMVLLFRKTFLAERDGDEDDDDVYMYVRDGHTAEPQDHDIDLKNNS